MKILLLLPLLLGFSIPAIAHNEASGGSHSGILIYNNPTTGEGQEHGTMGESAETDSVSFDTPANFGQLE